MTDVRARASSTLMLALVAAGCASPPPPAAGGGPASHTGDQLLAAGDYEGAARAYERDLAGSPGSSDVKEKLATAKLRAAVTHADAAMRAADAGNLELAESELARADSFEVFVPAIRDAREAVQKRSSAARKAADLRAQADSLVATAPEEAERLYAEAEVLVPAGRRQSSARVDATLRAEADRSADRASDAWAARDLDRTARELDGATVGGKPIAKADALRRRIEHDLVAEMSQATEAQLRDSAEFANTAGLNPAVVRLLRDRLVDKLLVSAQSLRETGHPATTSLLEIEAKRLRGDVKTPSFDSVKAAATVTILVHPFAVESGVQADGAQVARALRERITLDAFGGGQPVLALDDSEAARAAHHDAVIVTGRVLSARITNGRIGRETRKVSYQTGTAQRTNPRFTAGTQRLADAEGAVRQAIDAQKSADAALKQVKGEGLKPGADGKSPLQDPQYQAKLAAAHETADVAERNLAQARAAELAARQELQSTPRDVAEPVLGETTVVVTMSQKTAQITAHVDVASGEEVRLAFEVSAEATHKETTSPGFAPAGVAPDPDETPSDAAVAAQAADKLAGLAAGRVRTASQGAAFHFLAEGRAAQRDGRRDEASERYAMYLLATPEVASTERAEAARALADLLGVHVVLRTGARKESP